MANILDTIKVLREETGAGVMDCRNALEECGGDLNKAKELLRQKGIEKAAKKSERVMKSGLVYAYIHGGGRVGALLELGCETDFVARTDDFQNLCKEIGMQIASMGAQTVEELLNQAYIRDSKLSIKELISNSVAKIGENIQVLRFVRYSLGETVTETDEV